MMPTGLELKRNDPFLVVLVLLFGFTRHIAEGICSVEQCTDQRRCVLSKDQRSCKCVVGYYGDQCENDAHIQVMCGRDYMSIRAVEDLFKYYNMPLESLHLPNKSCLAQKEVINGVTYYMSRLSKDEFLACGGKLLVKNFTHISYFLSLLSDPQVTGNIIRDPIIKMDYTCDYPYVRKISLPFPVIPFSSETVLQADELDVTIQMMLYTDHTYSKPFSSAPTIQLNDKVYVQVAVTDHADYFLLRINECWATQSHQANSTESSVHTLLQNGCVNDHTVIFLDVSEEQSGRNGESATVRYSFDMFRFTTEPYELYLHCTVQLCDSDDRASCIPNCNSISKREAVRTDAREGRGLLSYGPIRIEVPDTPQSSVLLTVVLVVTGIWSVGFLLLILTTVAKARRRRLAQMQH